MVSQAGREFCYADIIYAPNTFIECDLKDDVKMFDCCKQLGGVNLSLIYDCRVSLPGSGTCGTD